VVEWHKRKAKWSAKHSHSDPVHRKSHSDSSEI
jgi:hypothetical protein